MALSLLHSPLASMCLGGPCYPGTEFCGKPFTNAPTFHLMDQHGCGENDPNGPVFDPVHGVIHHFYQIHLAAYPGHGPDYGHFVSKDFVTWAAMPVAIWNGLDVTEPGVTTPWRVTPYDNEAIFTGSAVIVDGAGPGGKGPGIVQIYPGLCNKNDWESCHTGTLLAQAVPSNYATDELLTNWSKPLYNPIVNNTQRDPSTPWKTPSGEWRLRTYDQMIYAAKSDQDLLAGRWYTVGKDPDLRQCECPSLYELPPPTPGFEAEYEEARKSRNGLPTHVHKTSCSGDWWQLGNYIDGKPPESGMNATLGTFNATIGWEDLFTQKKIDVGKFYASKDSLYPTKGSTSKRRINWGWAQVPPQSTQTVPREITFNAATRTLEQAPIAELIGLRTLPAAYTSGPQTLSGRMGLPVTSDIVKGSEVIVEFELPRTGSGDFGIVVGDPAYFGQVTAPMPLEVVDWVVEDDVTTSRLVEEAAIEAAPNTKALSCLLSYSPPADYTRQSEKAYYEVPVQCGPYKDTLRILNSATTVTMRLYLDATFVEAYFESGRVAITTPVDVISGGKSRIALTSTLSSTQVSSVEVYKMKSIWVSPEEVRKAPRVYNASGW